MSQQDDAQLIAQLRQELAQAREEHQNVLERQAAKRADLMRERDDALERADDMVLTLDEVQRRRDELVNIREELSADNAALAAERDQALGAARRAEELLEEDHQRTIARMLERHEREISRVATERDGALVEAERASVEAKRAFERADKARHELLVERRRLDRLLSVSNDEVQRLSEERDLALTRVDDLAAMHEAAEAEILRVGEEFMTVEEEKKKQQAKLTRLHDTFINELLEGHEKELNTISGQRDETRARLESLTEQVIEARTAAEEAAAKLSRERDIATRLAEEREAAALELDRMAKEQASVMEAAQVAAQQDKFIEELTDAHAAELASAERARQHAEDQLERVEAELGEVQGSLTRVTAERDRLRLTHGELAAENKRVLEKAQTDNSELKATVTRLRLERDEAKAQAHRDIADLKNTIARLVDADDVPQPAPSQVDQEDIAHLKRTITRLLEERDKIADEAERDIADLKGTITRLLQSGD